jgi:hypothetical protein
VPFSNPIVAGNTLIRDAIQSEGYTPGTVGWAIERDGDAEFNDVNIRGTVEVASPIDPTDVITIAIVADRPFVTWSFNGRSYSAFVSESASGSQFIIDDTAGGPDFRIFGDLDIVAIGGTGGRNVTADDGYLRYVTGSSTLTADTWISVTGYLNLWTGTVQYKKLPTGELIFRGLATGGTNTSGTDIFVMPAGYRPEAGHPSGGPRFVCQPQTNSADGAIQVVAATGIVEILRPAGAAQYYFDQVRYSLI